MKQRIASPIQAEKLFRDRQSYFDIKFCPLRAIFHSRACNDGVCGRFMIIIITTQVSWRLNSDADNDTGVF
jgi:hypothetical protein